MSRGFVYVLKNESMKGLVKIGMTTRTTEDRANELFTSGVPTPFEIYHEVYSPDCAELEALTHDMFVGDRVNDSREFFTADPDGVCNYIEQECRFQVQNLVRQFLPFGTVFNADYIIQPADVSEAAIANGIEPTEIKDVLSLITADEMAPLVKRYIDAREEARPAQLRVVS